MPKKILINDPVINELTYDAIFHATKEQRQKLTQTQLRQIKTEKRAKQFSVTSTLDEKLIMLANLGIGYVLKIAKKNALTPKYLKELYEKYKKDIGEDCVNDLHVSHAALVSDRQVSTFYNMLSNICHSDTYMINRDFHKIGYHLLGWEETEHITNEQVYQTHESVMAINKHTLNVAMALKEVRGITQIADIDLNILMFLFNRKNSYVPRENVISFLRMAYKITIISAAIKRLVEGAYLEKHPNHTHISYLISSLGIDTVMAFHRKTLNDTFNY